MPYPYNFDTINRRAAEDPFGFARECEAIFNRKVAEAAASIAEHATVSGSHVVFLSGPSGSGKTTTAQKICDALKKLRIRAETISLDRYYLTPNRESTPLTESGEYDLESPYCLDLGLLLDQFNQLERGEEVLVPHFDFQRQERDLDKSSPLRVADDAIVIFEGIHALNDILTDGHPSAFKLYISARSDIECDGEICFKRTWTRLLRRVVRDEHFRGHGAMKTLKMWGTVRDGEKKYISPFKYKADILFDSSLEYEVPVMKRFALKAFNNIPEGTERGDELHALLPELTDFTEVDHEVVPGDSILREFIGGGIYDH